MLKSKKPNIKFIIVGDFNQLKPVKDRVQCNYKQCLPLIDLCDCNRLELSICRRSDDTLFNMCKFKNIMNIKKSNFNSKQTSKCISFLHKTRIEINNKCMNEKIKKYKEKALRWEKNKFDPHSQDVKLLPGMPIICKKNCKKLEIFNNETFTIKEIDFDNDIIIIENDTKINIFNIKSKDFQIYFYLAYCITIHVCQGETFDEPYTIYDFDKY